VHHGLEGVAGEGVGLPGGGGLGDLLLEGVRQAALEELPAGAARLVVRGVLGALAAALVEYGDHRRPPRFHVLELRGPLGGWEEPRKTTLKSHVYIYSNGDVSGQDCTGAASEHHPHC